MLWTTFIAASSPPAPTRPAASRWLPVAQALGEYSLMFLVHPTLTPAEIQKTCEVVRAVLAEAGA